MWDKEDRISEVRQSEHRRKFSQIWKDYMDQAFGSDDSADTV